MTDFRLVW